jgi:Uncharacterized conserved protein
MLKKILLKSQELKKQIAIVYYAYQDPQLGLLPKVLLFITLGYALSPIDLIPDFIPIIGYLDDLIIVPALISLSIKLIPKDIWNKAKLKAEQQPLKLKKNWIFGALFILIWIFIAIVLFFNVL